MFQKTTVKQDMDLECFPKVWVTGLRSSVELNDMEVFETVWMFGSLEIGINWLEFGWITVGDVGGN